MLTMVATRALIAIPSKPNLGTRKKFPAMLVANPRKEANTARPDAPDMAADFMGSLKNSGF